jgi:hypothetical protein
MNNPIRKLVEMFLPQEVSPLKPLPAGHPQKQYSYTFVGYNNKPISSKSLLQLGFVGQVKGASDYIVAQDELLFKDLNTVVKISMLFNIPKIRKYHDTGHGIEWESKSKLVYMRLVEAQLFDA